MSEDLSLVISRNTSLQILILLDNMLQTGLISIARACKKLNNLHILQLAHNCIIPSKVLELTTIITECTSLETVLLGGITLNAKESFHFNITKSLHKTVNTGYFNYSTFLELIYLELLRKEIDNNRKCSISINAKNFIFIQKILHYKLRDTTQLGTMEADKMLAQIDAKKIISSLYILKKVSD